MKKTCCLLSAVGLMTWSVSCITVPPSKTNSYFYVIPVVIKQKVKTVVIPEVQLPFKSATSEAISRQFLDKVAFKLDAAGFKVLPSDVFTTVNEGMKKRVGDLYDPKTGKIYSEKAQAVWKHTLAELKTKYQVDAIVSCYVDVFNVEFSHGSAFWHGIEYSVGSNAYSYNGTVGVLSLVFALIDVQGTELYRSFGGLQPEAQIQNGAFVKMSSDELLTDQQRNDKAVEVAMESFLLNMAQAGLQSAKPLDMKSLIRNDAW